VNSKAFWRASSNLIHACPDWDYMAISAESPEAECCTCEKKKKWCRTAHSEGDTLRESHKTLRAQPRGRGEDYLLTVEHTADLAVAAILSKQQRVEARNWPDWRTAPADKAIEHLK
jgi:hypothetical protein